MTDIDPAVLALGCLDDLNTVPEVDWVDGTVTELGLRLLRLQALARAVKSATEAIEQALAERMELDAIDMPGFGRMRRSESTSSAWRYEGASEQMRDDLARAVANTVALDVATGEVDPARRGIALAAMREAYRAIPSFSSLKTDGRKALGLRLGDYRTYATHYRVEVEAIDAPFEKGAPS